MTLKALMNGNGTVDHDIGSLVSGGTFSILSVPSVNVQADNAGVYRGTINGTFTGGNASGFEPGSVAGAWSISPTATAVNVDGQAVVRDGDIGTLTATGTIPPPTGGTGPVTGTVVVNNAGQGVVNGD